MGPVGWLRGLTPDERVCGGLELFGLHAGRLCGQHCWMVILRRRVWLFVESGEVAVPFEGRRLHLGVETVLDTPLFAWLRV